MQTLTGNSYDNMIIDCLALRDSLQLSEDVYKRQVHVKAELFIKLWVVIVMNIFVYDILSKIKVVFGTDSLAIEREAFLSLYLPIVGFIALKLLDCWFINEC